MDSSENKNEIIPFSENSSLVSFSSSPLVKRGLDIFDILASQPYLDEVEEILYGILTDSENYSSDPNYWALLRAAKLLPTGKHYEEVSRYFELSLLKSHSREMRLACADFLTTFKQQYKTYREYEQLSLGNALFNAYSKFREEFPPYKLLDDTESLFDFIADLDDYNVLGKGSGNITFEDFLIVLTRYYADRHRFYEYYEHGVDVSKDDEAIRLEYFKKFLYRIGNLFYTRTEGYFFSYLKILRDLVLDYPHLVYPALKDLVDGGHIEDALRFLDQVDRKIPAFKSVGLNEIDVHIRIRGLNNLFWGTLEDQIKLSYALVGKEEIPLEHFARKAKDFLNKVLDPAQDTNFDKARFDFYLQLMDFIGESEKVLDYLIVTGEHLLDAIDEAKSIYRYPLNELLSNLTLLNHIMARRDYASVRYWSRVLKIMNALKSLPDIEIYLLGEITKNKHVVNALSEEIYSLAHDTSLNILCRFDMAVLLCHSEKYAQEGINLLFQLLDDHRTDVTSIRSYDSTPCSYEARLVSAGIGGDEYKTGWNFYLKQLPISPGIKNDKKTIEKFFEIARDKRFNLHDRIDTCEQLLSIFRKG